MRIAAEMRKLVSRSAAEVHTWMTNPDNIRWGLYHVPKLRTVKDFNTRHSLSLTGRSVNPAASLFEWPTKLNIILESAQQNPFLVVMYIMESLLAFMLRKKPKTHFAGDLTEKGGDIETSLRTSAAIRIRFP